MIPWEKLGVGDESINLIQTRPAVHELCYGAFLSERICFEEGLWAIPLQPMGCDEQIKFLFAYAGGLIRVTVDDSAIMEARMKSLISYPITVFLCIPNSGSTPQELAASARPRLDLAREVVACTAGEEIVPFSIFVCDIQGHGHYELLHPKHNRTRTRITNIMNMENEELHQKLFSQASSDEPFRFALSLLHDATRETNPRFQIARLFNVLECLASEQKNEGFPPRKAVRMMLGLSPDGDIRDWDIAGATYHFDIIEFRVK